MTPTVAVAFGGGGARGLAHIHVIEALDELGVRPTAIAGSSIGAIMGAAMAAGMSGRDIRVHTMSILSRKAEIASRMWRARPGSFGEALSGGLRFTQFNAERILGAFLPEALPAGFEDLEIPLRVTATDYYNQSLAVFTSGELISALAASSAIPAVFRPVTRGGVVYIDGGIFDPVPFTLLSGLADIVMAVDVIGAPVETPDRRPNSIDLMFGATQLMMQAIIAGRMEHSPPDILIRPSVARFRVLDFLKADQVLAESAGVKDEVKRRLSEHIESCLRRTG